MTRHHTYLWLIVTRCDAENRGGEEDDDDDDVKGEWSVELKVLQKEIKRLRRSLCQVEAASVVS